MFEQVEDMLKRSFAEFHAQRSHPGAVGPGLCPQGIQAGLALC